MISSRALSVIGMVLSLASWTALAAFAGPSIQFDSERHDFGHVEEGSKAKVEFSFKNVGDADLEITKVDNSCGCADINIGSKKLAPGESSKITVVFRTIGCAGKVNRRIDVYTNDPGHVGVGLRVSGVVDVIATNDPERLNFGTVKPGSTAIHTVRVIPVDPKTFNIAQVSVDGSHVSVPSFKRIDDKNGPYWELQVKITAGNTTGRVHELVMMSTKAGEDPHASFPVYGNVKE